VIGLALTMILMQQYVQPRQVTIDVRALQEYGFSVLVDPTGGRWVCTPNIETFRRREHRNCLIFAILKASAKEYFEGVQCITNALSVDITR
jgi:hypothetical protein